MLRADGTPTRAALYQSRAKGARFARPILRFAERLAASRLPADRRSGGTTD